MNHKYTKAVDRNLMKNSHLNLSREDEDDFEETLDILEVKIEIYNYNDITTIHDNIYQESWVFSLRSK